MSLIWLVLLGTDCLMVILVAMWLVERRRLLKARDNKRIEASLNVLESRANRQEFEWTQFREEMQKQLGLLNRICSEAQRILKKSQNSLGNSVPSLEECELKIVAEEQSPFMGEAMIPTLREIEKTSKRLKSEVSLDLGQLLKEQLT